MFPQNTLDLTQLDSVTPDLYLVVNTTQELDVSVWKPTAKVPGTVDPGTRICTERISKKLLRGQLCPVKVTPCHTRTPDADLARNANRLKAQGGINYIYPRIRYGMAKYRSFCSGFDTAGNML
jgi:hypothetical protein